MGSGGLANKLQAATITATAATELGATAIRCQRFDISLPEDNDNQVRLYEVYTDQAAFDRHVATEHMKEFRADTASMVASRELIRGALAND